MFGVEASPTNKKAVGLLVKAGYRRRESSRERGFWDTVRCWSRITLNSKETDCMKLRRGNQPCGRT